MIVYNNPAPGEWEALCKRADADNAAIEPIVRDIIEKVRTSGDEAIKDLALKIDGVSLQSLEVSEAEFEEAAQTVSSPLKEAIEAAYANIYAFHKAQMPSEISVQTAPGVTCIQRPVAIQKVGLYVPGGTAPLFSTVLMLAIPALVAGCPLRILCTPCNKEGKVAPAVLYAARRCGVGRVFKVGGAQAVAAMAFGTETIPAVDKIFGPGNRFVTTAKQLLGGKKVAIDMPAGPSEVMVIADSQSNPAFVASDLLSQAEHGRDSQAILVCKDALFAEAVNKEIDRQTALLSRGEYIASSLKESRAVVFDNDADALAFANEYAPEHLIISRPDADGFALGVTSAGSVFLGCWSPESAGDYASGTNHTLPTSAWGRSYSGVNLDSYMRKMTLQRLTREGLEGLGQTIIEMAEAEGLDAHANAVKTRLA